MRLTGDAVDPKGGIMYSDGTVCIGCAKLAPTEPIGAGLANALRRGGIVQTADCEVSSSIGQGLPGAAIVNQKVLR